MYQFLRAEDMKNSFNFFQNKDCEFFPCHRVENEDSFNCLFCYCPLYFDEHCIGDPKYVVNGNGQRIRDCSDCEKVHDPAFYQCMMDRLKRQDEVVLIDVGELRKEIQDRLSQLAHWEDMDDACRLRQKEEAEQVLERVWKKQYQIQVLIQPFDPGCLKRDFIELGRIRIKSNIFAKIDRKQICSGYIYTFHAPELNIEDAKTVLEQYYLEAFQVACMDIVRVWIQGYLERKNSLYKKKYCSPSFGPGYWGIDGNESYKLLDSMESEKVGVTWNGNSMLPKMSVTGIYLVSDEDIWEACPDCQDCIGSKEGCDFCLRWKK